MRKILFLLVIFLFNISIFSYEFKYVGKSGDLFKFDNSKNIFLKAGIHGNFIYKLSYGKKIHKISVAKFVIKKTERNFFIAKDLKWGKGWSETEISAAFIKPSEINNAMKIESDLRSGIELFEKKKYKASLNFFKSVLSVDKGNKIASKWVEKITSKILDNGKKEEELSYFITKMNFPSKYKNLIKVSSKVYLNNKGYWEAKLPQKIILIYIPSGYFQMGDNNNNEDEEPMHKVFLNGYWISKYEINYEIFKKFLDETNYKTESEEFYVMRNDFPVRNITWKDSLVFCNWITKKTGFKVDLPTEAQWEKAARGTKGNRKYPWGDHSIKYNGKYFANFQSKEDGFKYLAPFNSFNIGSSEFGVVNMLGNISEWVRDWYDENYYSKNIIRNPKGPLSGQFKVIRGGSYIDFDFSLRCSVRDKVKPISAREYIGFRIVLTN